MGTDGNSLCAFVILRVDSNGGSRNEGIRWIDDHLVGWIEPRKHLDGRSVVASDGDWYQLSLVVAHDTDAQPLGTKEQGVCRNVERRGRARLIVREFQVDECVSARLDAITRIV